MVVNKSPPVTSADPNGISSIETVPVRALPDGRLPASEAAKYLGVAEKTLANWRSQGRGPRFLKRARRVWYRKEWLDAWVQSGDRSLELVQLKPKRSPQVASKPEMPKDQSVRGADICTLRLRVRQPGDAKPGLGKKGSGGTR